MAGNEAPESGSCTTDDGLLFMYCQTLGKFLISIFNSCILRACSANELGDHLDVYRSFSVLPPFLDLLLLSLEHWPANWQGLLMICPTTRMTQVGFSVMHDERTMRKLKCPAMELYMPPEHWSFLLFNTLGRLQRQERV
jgi:hypothetical protein